jgi:hypothetical protein
VLATGFHRMACAPSRGLACAQGAVGVAAVMPAAHATYSAWNRRCGPFTEQGLTAGMGVLGAVSQLTRVV